MDCQAGRGKQDRNKYGFPERRQDQPHYHGEKQYHSRHSPPFGQVLRNHASRLDESTIVDVSLRLPRRRGRRGSKRTFGSVQGTM